jgi:hypothetical protein
MALSLWMGCPLREPAWQAFLPAMRPNTSAQSIATAFGAEVVTDVYFATNQRPAQGSIQGRSRLPLRRVHQLHPLKKWSLRESQGDSNIDINIASTTPEVRAYSLDCLTETVRLAGELGVCGVVMSPGKPSPLLPAKHEVLTLSLCRARRPRSDCEGIRHRFVDRKRDGFFHDALRVRSQCVVYL